MSRLGRVFLEDDTKEEFEAAVSKIREKYAKRMQQSKDGAIGWALDALDDVSKIPTQLAERSSKKD